MKPGKIVASLRKGKLVLTCERCSQEKVYDEPVSTEMVKRLAGHYQKLHLECKPPERSLGKSKK